jgi:peptidoglycan/LPS O-acetylase OafA/YrhL
MINSKRTLDEVLVRNGNNLDLFRLLAAFAVIYGHSFALAPNVAGGDYLFQFTGFYSADIAVKSFFFMSGLLIVNSILQNKSPLIYVVHRAFRIIPGLILVLLVSTFVVGPLFTTLPINEYFNDPNTYEYIPNMLFNSWGGQNLGYYNLPGVFLNNPVGRNINAPLWTLAVEIFAYIFILSIFLVGGFKKYFVVVPFVIILIDSLLPEPLIFHWLPINNHNFSLIPYCFAVGALMAVYKKYIKISYHLPLGLLFLCFMLKGSIFDLHIAYGFSFTFILFLSTRTIIKNITIRNDISYGVYLYGWLFQQSIAYLFPDIMFTLFVILSIVLAVVMASISWVLVERPSIHLGKNISAKIKQWRMHE